MKIMSGEGSTAGKQTNNTMDINIKNAIRRLHKWKDVSGFNVALKEAVNIVDKIMDDRSKEKPMDVKIKPCPDCGCENGYYRKGTISGRYQCFYTAEGENGDNTHIHDGLNYTEHKTKFCEDCKEPLPKSVFE